MSKIQTAGLLPGKSKQVTYTGSHAAGELIEFKRLFISDYKYEFISVITFFHHGYTYFIKYIIIQMAHL